MDERRRSPRRRKLLTGKIIMRDMSEWSCVVRDLSEGGARVRIDQLTSLPEHFDLSIESLKERRATSTIWRRDGEIGLAFDS